MIYTLKEQGFFIPQESTLPPSEEISLPQRMHFLNLLQFFFLFHCKIVLVQGQVTDLHIAKSLVNSQFPSYWTSHLHLPQPVTPSSFMQFLQLACGTSHSLVFSSYLLVAPSQVLAGFFLLAFLLILENPRAQCLILFTTCTQSLGDLIRHPGFKLIHVPMIPYFMSLPKVSPGLQTHNCLLNFPTWIFI